MLESESNITIDWFTKSEIIIKPDKFKTIIFDKNKSNLTNIPLTIDNQTIKSVPSVKLLGIHLDNNLNFNLHISNTTKKLFKLEYKKSLNQQLYNFKF